MILCKHELVKRETKLGLACLGKLQRLVLAMIARQRNPLTYGVICSGILNLETKS